MLCNNANLPCLWIFFRSYWYWGGGKGMGEFMKVNDWIAGLRANQIPVIGYSRWLTGNSSLHNAFFNGNRIGVTNLSITIGSIWGEGRGDGEGEGVFKTLSSIYHGAFSCDCFCRKSSIIRDLHCLKYVSLSWLV